MESTVRVLTGGGAAAEEASRGRRQGRVDLDDLVHVHHGVLAEAGNAEEVVERDAAGVAEPGGVVARHPRAHRERELGAYVAPGWPAVSALAALRQERRHHRVPRGEALHVLAHALHHPVTDRPPQGIKIFNTSSSPEVDLCFRAK